MSVVDLILNKVKKKKKDNYGFIPKSLFLGINQYNELLQYCSESQYKGNAPIQVLGDLQFYGMKVKLYLRENYISVR